MMLQMLIGNVEVAQQDINAEVVYSVLGQDVIAEILVGGLKFRRIFLDC